MKNTKQTRNKLNALALVTIVNCLVQGPHTRKDLQDESGLQPLTANRVVELLHDRGLVHICDWLPDTYGRRVIAVFRWGNKPDKARPAPLPKAELRSRANVRQRHARKNKKVSDALTRPAEAAAEREARLAARREKYQANIEHERARAARRREAKREVIQAKAREWYARNRDEINAKEREKRALKKDLDNLLAA